MDISLQRDAEDKYRVRFLTWLQCDSYFYYFLSLNMQSLRKTTAISLFESEGNDLLDDPTILNIIAEEYDLPEIRDLFLYGVHPNMTGLRLLFEAIKNSNKTVIDSALRAGDTRVIATLIKYTKGRSEVLKLLKERSEQLNLPNVWLIVMKNRGTVRLYELFKVLDESFRYLENNREFIRAFISLLDRVALKHLWKAGNLGYCTVFEELLILLTDSQREELEEEVRERQLEAPGSHLLSWCEAQVLEKHGIKALPTVGNVPYEIIDFYTEDKGMWDYLLSIHAVPTEAAVYNAIIENNKDVLLQLKDMGIPYDPNQLIKYVEGDTLKWLLTNFDPDLLENIRDGSYEPSDVRTREYVTELGYGHKLAKDSRGAWRNP